MFKIRIVHGFHYWLFISTFSKLYSARSMSEVKYINSIIYYIGPGFLLYDTKERFI